MSVQVEKLEHNMAKLTITVPAETFNKAITQAYKKMKNQISIPGFRKGKVPQAMVEKMYGAGMFYEDAANIVIPEEYDKALAEVKDIKITSQPAIDVTQMEKGKDFIFTAEVATKPEVTLGQYKGIEVPENKVEVTDEEIEAELKKVQEQNAREITVDRPAENGDTVVIDFEGSVDGEVFEGGTAENHPLVLGSGSFIPGFEDQLVGATADSDVEVNVTFPEDYQATELAGKEATFKVTVHEIKEKVLPEADDELAKDVNIEGVETLDQLKDHIKAQLKSQKENEVENKFFSDLTQALIECCKVEDSEALLNSELDTMLREVEMNLQQQGLSFELYEQFTGKNKDAIKADLTDQAKDRVKLNLILAAIVEAENIEVTDEERNSELETIANTYNRDLEEIKQIFAQNMYQIDADILNRKALDVVKENLKK